MGNVKLLWMYLISRLRWILWIIFLNIIILVIAAIDYNIDIGSVVYIVILNIGLTLVYLIFSFIKEFCSNSFQQSAYFVHIVCFKRYPWDISGWDTEKGKGLFRWVFPWPLKRCKCGNIQVWSNHFKGTKMWEILGFESSSFDAN